MNILLKVIFLSFNFFALQDVLQDNFDNNEKNWSLGNYEKFNSKIQDGKLILESYSIDQFKYLTKSISSCYEYDFYLKADFKHISGVDNHGFGLVWGTKDLSNLFFFVITKNGYSSIYKNENGLWNPLKTWTSFDFINIDNTANKLEIQQKNKHLYFLINGELLFDTIASKPFGNKIGFCINNKMKVEIDNLEFRYFDKNKINVVENPVRETAKENLGPNINTEYSEILPIITHDGSGLYFVRKNSPENLGKEHFDDIYYSKKVNDSTWSKAIRLGHPLNNDGNNSVVSESPDGNSVLLMNQYSEDGTKITGGGLSKSVRTKDGWSIPKAVQIVDYYNDNPQYYENQFLSADNKILLTSVQRKEGYGENDIYVSFFDGEKYSKPKNLGPIINSYGDDMSPYLASDGRTLYFSSNGHPGYGEYDVFISRRIDETWTNWTKPLNLGDAINSPQTEAYFTIPASGDYAYMMTNKNTFGGTDLIRLKLTKESQPDPVVLLYGKVYNSANNQPIGTNIVYYNLITNQELGTAISDPNTGEYKIVLPYGMMYSYFASYEGFYSVSENIDLTLYSEYKEIEKNLYLTPVESGVTFRLNNIFFDYKKFDLRQESFYELNRLLSFLSHNPKIKIEISGHTDNIGGDEYNNKLSNDRASSVLSYLITGGIDKNRLVSIGYGRSKPVSTNDTDEGRQLNRRVEVKILSD